MIIDLSKINFGGGGGSKIKVQDVKVVTQNVDSSGAYDFQPDEGYDAMKVLRANLNIPTTPVQSIDLKTGIKFGNSTFSAMPFTLICDSRVMNLGYLFDGCGNLKTLDLSNFDTSKVIIMSDMFNSCKSLTDLDLSNFNTVKIDNMRYMKDMFYNCRSLTTVKVINCNEATKNKILTQLQTDMSSYTWTLGDDGIIRRSEKTS